ncbi:MAG: type II toxin-antitoxin system VapC family toxin [Candidatus Thermoplasmatota archaeon]|jgi:predicted nucleic acid-binding protein|nr:type II toxin-antitoxin system VapC family toxin [Candidatus Thermoplasmatota archaeon]
MKGTYYIDANVFLYPVLYQGLPQVDSARKVLTSIEKKEIQAYTSTLTWDEVSYVTGKLLGRTDSVEIGRKFLNFPNLRFVAMDEKVMRRGQKVREQYDLKPRDSIHLSSAIERNVRKIISDDSDFDGIREIERVALTGA